MLKFFLPNFEDMVDPEYDFETDTNSPKRGKKHRWRHDWYAHQFFDEPIFDGMLISKAVFGATAEKHVLEVGGVHQFVNLDPQIPIMGDCGAFTYLLEEKPVYSVQEVLDYYHGFGFDYGVSLDHLAFVNIKMLESALQRNIIKSRWWEGKTDEQLRQERIQISLDNAREFMHLCEQQHPCFKPIGIAQGGTPEMYYDSVRQLIEMGYENLALGGLVRSSDDEILTILRKLKPLLTAGIKMHIFGVARLSLVPEFIRLGVTSADSASVIRQAFLGAGENNYWAKDGQKYAAIRVPEAGSKYKKRGVDTVDAVLQRNDSLSEHDLAALEQKALRLLRIYDAGKCSLEETLEAVLTYDQLYGVTRDYEKAYRRTLSDRPWQECGCAICKAVGVEVIIFRGNNRNRRRGFHNVKVFYEQFRKTTAEPAQAPKDEAVADSF